MEHQVQGSCLHYWHKDFEVRKDWGLSERYYTSFSSRDEWSSPNLYEGFVTTTLVEIQPFLSEDLRRLDCNTASGKNYSIRDDGSDSRQ